MRILSVQSVAVASIAALMHFGGGAEARAEDTAAVLAAMPDPAAEDRYMVELCTRVTHATRELLSAIDAETACAAADCEKMQTLRAEQQAAEASRSAFLNDYRRAGAVYRSKRATDPSLCEPAAESGEARITARLQTFMEAYGASARRQAQAELDVRCRRMVGDFETAKRAIQGVLDCAAEKSSCSIEELLRRSKLNTEARNAAFRAADEYSGFEKEMDGLPGGALAACSESPTAIADHLVSSIEATNAALRSR